MNKRIVIVCQVIIFIVVIHQAWVLISKMVNV